MKPRIAALLAVAKDHRELRAVAKDLPTTLKDAARGQASPGVRGGLLMAALGLAYVVSPVDLMPEVILGPIGLVDDLMVASWSLNAVVEAVRTHRTQALEPSRPAQDAPAPLEH
jgi:uncharacterized membrane protein YkvA (DUF1232 family)